VTRQISWLVQKDLVSAYRARRVWPETFQLGVLVAILFGLQIELPGEHQRRIAGVLLWFAILFASLPTLERSFASEREDDCLDGLFVAPVSRTAVYLAKLLVNLIVLSTLEVLLIPLWVALLGVPLLAAPAAMALVAILATLGIAAVGTLLSAILSGLGPRTGGLALLILPLLLPVMLAASEATRLIEEHDFGLAWWRWVGLLASFAVVFITAGCVLFEFAIGE
jgi:heme exporter protein B